MNSCKKCKQLIPRGDVYYDTTFLGDELLVALDLGENSIEANDESYVCEKCFLTALQTLDEEHQQTKNVQNIIGNDTQDIKILDGYKTDQQQKNNKQQRKIVFKKRIEYQQKSGIPEKLCQTGESSCCGWCGSDLHNKRSHILSNGPERYLISELIAPREISGDRVCYACWVAVQRRLKRLNIEAMQVKLKDDSEPTINLPNYKRSGNSHSCCFVHGCRNAKKMSAPKSLRLKLLRDEKFFVSEKSRICSEHLNAENWQFLKEGKYINTFNAAEIQSMMLLFDTSSQS